MQWVVEAYALFLAALLLVGGSLGTATAGGSSSVWASPFSHSRPSGAGQREARCALDGQRARLAGAELPPSVNDETRAALRQAINGSFVFGFRRVMAVDAGMALASALIALIMIEGEGKRRSDWELLVFVLNSVIFILIGLQLGALRDAVPAGELGPVILIGALVSLTAIIVRLLWVPVAAWAPRRVSPRLRARDPMPPWSHLFIIGWTGMRGIVSLASALALPLATAAGTPFPFRAEIILIAFMVILVTLVLQGLSLPPLIRALKAGEDRGFEDDEREARKQAASATLAHWTKWQTKTGPCRNRSNGCGATMAVA